MKLTDLQALLIHELKDLLWAEKHLTKALPKMARAATTPELEEAFLSHLEETKTHVERVESMLETLGVAVKGQKCKGMEGIVAEGEELIEEKKTADPSVLDAGLITAAQRVEHYEIAGYGSARNYAELLGHAKIAELIQQTLDEEGAADKKLTQIAKAVNKEAMKAGEPANV